MSKDINHDEPSKTNFREKEEIHKEVQGERVVFHVIHGDSEQQNQQKTHSKDTVARRKETESRKQDSGYNTVDSNITSPSRKTRIKRGRIRILPSAETSMQRKTITKKQYFKSPKGLFQLSAKPYRSSGNINEKDSSKAASEAFQISRHTAKDKGSDTWYKYYEVDDSNSGGKLSLDDSKSIGRFHSQIKRDSNNRENFRSKDDGKFPSYDNFSNTETLEDGDVSKHYFGWTSPTDCVSVENTSAAPEIYSLTSLIAEENHGKCSQIQRNSSASVKPLSTACKTAVRHTCTSLTAEENNCKASQIDRNSFVSGGPLAIVYKTKDEPSSDNIDTFLQDTSFKNQTGRSNKTPQRHDAGCNHSPNILAITLDAVPKIGKLESDTLSTPSSNAQISSTIFSSELTPTVEAKKYLIENQDMKQRSVVAALMTEQFFVRPSGIKQPSMNSGARTGATCKDLKCAANVEKNPVQNVIKDYVSQEDCDVFISMEDGKHNLNVKNVAMGDSKHGQRITQKQDTKGTKDARKSTDKTAFVKDTDMKQVSDHTVTSWDQQNSEDCNVFLDMGDRKHNIKVENISLGRCKLGQKISPQAKNQGYVRAAHESQTGERRMGQGKVDALKNGQTIVNQHNNERINAIPLEKAVHEILQKGIFLCC